MGKNCITLDLARYSSALTSLTNEQLGLLMRHIIRYWQGENVEMNGYLKSFFELIRADIDKDKEEKTEDKYEEWLMKKRKQNRAYYLKRKANSASDSVNSVPDSVNSVPDSVNSVPDSVNSVPDSVNSVNSVPDSVNSVPETSKNSEKEKVIQKEKEERILFNEKEIYREKGGQTTLYSRKESEKRMPKPTVEQVHEYAQTLGYIDFDAQHFWDFYESKGWVVGRAPMKDWKRAVVNWQRNAIQRQKEREQRQRRGFGTSVGERAYNMLHFEYEGHPEMWEEEKKKIKELQKDI